MVTMLVLYGILISYVTYIIFLLIVTRLHAHLTQQDHGSETQVHEDRCSWAPPSG